MASDTCLRALLRVAKELSQDDLKSIKFLVSDIDGISRRWLESASATEVIETIDTSILAELLQVICRQDLYEELAKNVFADPSASDKLSEHKVLMYHIAQSMSDERRRNIRFILNADDESLDDIDLMALVETRIPVGNVHELRQAMNELHSLSLYDEALKADAASRADRERPEVVTRHAADRFMRTMSFCDGTGCKKNCAYRQLWTEKFPHQSSPVFSSERLLSHDDITTDGEEPIGEGRFGKIYRGQ